MMKYLLSGFCTLALVLTLYASPAMASSPSWMKDQYIDIYSGNAGYKARNVTGIITYYSLLRRLEQTVSRKVDFTSSDVFGARWGFWLEKNPLYGFAVDVSTQAIQGEDVKINLLPISCMLFFRYPWHVTEKYPHGRIQPYGGIGLSFMTGRVSVDFRPDLSTVVEGGASGNGVDMRAGLKWLFNKKTGLFAELRYLQGSISKSDEDPGFFPPFSFTGHTEEASTTINSQQLLVGFSVKL